MLVPGYRGYKMKELRREADKLVRNYMYQMLKSSEDDLRVVFQKLVENQMSDLWKDSDKLIADLDTVSSEINHASYGYAGFFDAVRVNDDRLDKMLDYDSKMIDNVASLSIKTKQLRNNILNGRFENVLVSMKDIRTVVDLLNSVYGERVNLIHGV
jgi:hypothetical protein